MKDSVRKTANVLGILFLLVVVVSIVVSLLKQGIWNETLGMNLLVVGDDSVGLLIMRPGEKLGSWLEMPKDLKINISGSQASYPINSVWRFGLGEKRPYTIAEKSIGESMGVIIPRMIKVEGSAGVEGVLGSLVRLSAKTDLAFLDRLSLRKYLTEVVNSKRLLELTIPDQVFEEVTEPDGKVFKEFTKVMSAWSKDKFLFEPVLAEEAELTINNLSGVAGVGLLLARMAETAGIRVTEVKNDESDRVNGKGCVFESVSGVERTVELLKNHFGCHEATGVGNDGGEMKLWLL